MGFAILGSGTLDSARSGRIEDGFLGAQLAGNDPVGAYFAYSGTVLGLVVAAVAATLVVQTAADEEDGLTEHVRATGTRPNALLSAYLLTALAAAWWSSPSPASPRP